MLKQISDKIIKNKSYEDDFASIYKADHNITDDEAEELMKKSYFYFPVTKSSYKLDGNKMTINYTVDHCN